MTDPAPDVRGGPYGPATPAVRAFLRDLAAHPPAAWERCARVYAVVRDSEAVVRADGALGAAMENAGLEAARDAVVGPVVQLAHATGQRLGAGDTGPGGAQRTADLTELLAESALAAVLALMVRDLLSAATFDALYAPFAALIPAPA